MPREAVLFDETQGSCLEAYLRLRRGGANIPPKWIERARASRKQREKELGKALKSKSLDAIHGLREWEVSYRKECFYHGIRALLEIERSGKTKL